MQPADLAQVLRHLKTVKDPRALVGYGTRDDAAVYRLTPQLAVVETVDFFPPVVDDPFDFGRIAAANALSDIWAMGARPLFALNLVGFPDDLPRRILGRILAGGQAKATEAGVSILGGHSIRDPEPKYGMAVTGVVHPRRVLTNAGARAGDVLILTKPLGSGIATTAIKRGLASKALVRRVIGVMAELNRAAGEVFASPRLRVHALTDVTGFGLLGHLLEMSEGAHLRAQIELERIPFIEGVPALAEKDIVPGGSRANLEWVERNVRFARGMPEPAQVLLADAQTNGGLLAALPRSQASRALAALRRAGAGGVLIGEFRRGSPGIDVS